MDLSSFRDQWKQELATQGTPRSDVLELDNQLENLRLQDNAEDPEIEARLCFNQAASLERSGKVFDAIPLYKRAVHLVPDIELKMHEWSKLDASDSKLNNNNNFVDYETNNTSTTGMTLIEGDTSSALDDNVDLYARFLESVQAAGRWCIEAQPSKATHISNLPLEVFLIISRWIVSNELDIQSLETSALVCKGFYLCACDPELWRVICMKAGNPSLSLASGSLRGSAYSSWRQMYFERTRLRLDGCYISKTHYFRYGENSFQDQFYKPVHNIEYFRYLRFFSDGVVLMLTTPDEPAVTVKKLKTRQPRKKEIMRGFYRLNHDVVTIMMNRKVSLDVPNISEKRGGGGGRGPVVPAIAYEQTFHIELKVQNSSKRRRNNQLHWQQYRIIQRKNGVESTSEFALNLNQYPMFFFSRVEHYSEESESMLAIK